MYDFLLKISKKIFTSSWSINKAVSKRKQLQYLDSITLVDNSLFNRSYLQYKCQMKFESTIKVILLNLISPFLILGIIIYGQMNSYSIRSSFESQKTKKKAINLGYSDLIPKSLKDEYNIIEGNKKLCFTINDLIFIKSIFQKYPFQWYFLFKCIFKIGIYSYIIKEYKPVAILTNSEYSFTSSILTQYCREQKIKHINYMHGEKIFAIRDSFFEFDLMYIWDEYYINLFNSLYANNEYVIEVPERFKSKNNTNRNQFEDELIIKYYLQWEDEIELEKINRVRILLKDEYKFIVRPHPRYSDTKLIQRIFPTESIESPYDVDIMSSIRNSYAVCSKYSTVFFQAYLQDKVLIIDDISNYKVYDKLKEFDYYIFHKDHSLLSEIVNNIAGDGKI